MVHEEREGLTRTSDLPLYPETLDVRRGPVTLDALTGLWSRRRTLLRSSLVGLLVAGVLAFLIAPEYESTTRLMPPDSQNVGAMALALLAGKGGEGLSSLAGDLTGMKSNGSLFIGILRSWTLEDRLIDSFQLRKVYRQATLKDTRETLANNTEISEDRKSGIISITVLDKSPTRARDLAHSYVEELNRLNAQLTTSAARREREFLEQRLQAVKVELDAAAKDLSTFSSQKSMLDVTEQGKAMVGAASAVEGELIATEAQLGSLRQIYTDNNYRITALEGRAGALRQQLEKLKGAPTSPGAANASPTDGDFPTIRQLPLLGVRYLELFRRLKIQEAVFETLTKQYELAKVSEAKETPVVRVLDPANVPEKKTSPHRLLMMFAGLMLGFFAATVNVLASDRMAELGADHPINRLRRNVRDGLAEDYAQFRSRNGASRPHRKDRDDPNNPTRLLD